MISARIDLTASAPRGGKAARTMGIIEELAAKAANAKANQNGNFIKPGKYLFEIQKLIAEKKHKGNMFIVEFKVLESAQTDPKHSPNPAGSSASYVVNLDNDSGPGNMKAFIMAVLEEPECNVTTDAIVEVLSASQPLRGLRVRDEAYEKPMRSKPGEMFTYHRWEAVPLTDEDLKAMAQARAQAAVPAKA